VIVTFFMVESHHKKTRFQCNTELVL
jgi:hypothetical protein